MIPLIIWIDQAKGLWFCFPQPHFFRRKDQQSLRICDICDRYVRKICEIRTCDIKGKECVTFEYLSIDLFFNNIMSKKTLWGVCLMKQEDVVIVCARRTPTGSFQGVFKEVSATTLGSIAIRAAFTQAGLTPEEVTEGMMGCVLSAGLGQSPCRQALLGAGLADSVGALTINKVCGSGLKAVMLAHDLLKVNPDHILIAGGMESMSMAPYLLTKGREGYRMGHAQMYDHMMLDGLEDAYQKGSSMGLFAEYTAEKYGFSRQTQDEYAIHTAQKALAAQAAGAFDDEIVPVDVPTKNETIQVAMDEPPSRVKVEKIPTLKAAFKKEGTVTAANASSISDGAAAVVMMTESAATKRGLQPLARIVAHASHSHAPEWFTTAPIGAIQKVLQKAKWSLHEVDLFEINEAFAVVVLAAIQDLKLPLEKVNVNGGACALGHPIGASGARILVTLLHALEKRRLKRGVASLCIGGGEGVALAVERF
jgi:acetyl-CoA C-acetyltransferase